MEIPNWEREQSSYSILLYLSRWTISYVAPHGRATQPRHVNFKKLEDTMRWETSLNKKKYNTI